MCPAPDRINPLLPAGQEILVGRWNPVAQNITLLCTPRYAAQGPSLEAGDFNDSMRLLLRSAMSFTSFRYLLGPTI